MRQRMERHSSGGFTILETMIALVILLVGVLGMGAMLTDAFMYMQLSQSDFIAQQKAEEAIEAIFTAKYDNSITYAQIANTTSTPPGIFLSGPQPVLQPGTDGLVGTATDSSAPSAYILQPGPDGVLGTADDIQQPLGNFTRTITITNVETNLSQVVVTVNYNTGKFNRSYTMTTYVSAY